MKTLNIHFEQRGFSLIEMMIGVAVGLFGLLAVSTVFINFNHHRTVETSLMDAQSNGATALFLLERDIDRAGYGFIALQGCSCDIDNAGATVANSSAFCEYWPSDTLAHPRSVIPITIADGGAAASDSVSVQYGVPSGGLSVNQVLAKQMIFTDDLQLKSVAGIAVNDSLVLNRGGRCSLYQATSVATATKSVSHVSGANIANPNAQPTVGYDTALPNDQLVNLGRYVSKQFNVNAAAAKLQESTPSTNNIPIVDSIVYMKADIGWDTDGDKLADTWAKTKPVAVTDYHSAIAMRVGVVSRTQATDNESPTPATLVVLPAITGGNQQDYAVPDRKYRYRVYYTVIPLRNMLWN